MITGTHLGLFEATRQTAEEEAKTKTNEGVHLLVSFSLVAPFEYYVFSVGKSLVLLLYPTLTYHAFENIALMEIVVGDDETSFAWECQLQFFECTGESLDRLT